MIGYRVLLSDHVLMFAFLKRKSRSTNLDWMQTDIHAHLLPGLDDGVSDIETAILAMRKLQALGILHFYATPHVSLDIYPNDAQSILSKWRVVQKSCAVHLPDVTLGTAAEYMVDSNFPVLYQSEQLLSLPQKHILVEMSYAAESIQLENHLFELNIRGYQVVLAHPERYFFYHKNPDRYQDLKSQGCLFQMNLLSPAGYYGSHVRKAALHLLHRGMVDFVGTDLHHLAHLSAIEKWVLSGDATEAFKRNPIKNRTLLG